jgi:selenide,water dikinase
LDFFTPIVDDPYWFGQIAAANAMSDVYAMDISILRAIIRGGLDKMKEAGVVLVGGHSVEDKELKYGLSVTGFIHPERILTKKKLAAGDRLILTKPLGTGIINTAIKGGLASGSVIEFVTRLMASLNKDAAEIMCNFPVHACTDITGFGLLGHMAEMVVDSGYGIKIQSNELPVIAEAFEYAEMGLIPGGSYRNREFRESIIEFSSSVDPLYRDIMFDPQTSGGLLVCVDGKSADALLDQLRKKGMGRAAVIGEVVSGPKEKIWVD